MVCSFDNTGERKVVNLEMGDVKIYVMALRSELLYSSFRLGYGSRAHVDVGTVSSKVRDGILADTRVAAGNDIGATFQVGQAIWMESHLDSEYL